MARIGACWNDGVWNTAAWTTGVWTIYIDPIGEAWMDTVWADGVWATTVWYPALSDAGGQLPRSKFAFKVMDLVVTEVTEDTESYDGILQGVTFTMAVGSVLDLHKILPVVKAKLSPGTLEAEVQGISVDANTLPVVVFSMSAVAPTVGVLLPPVTFTMAAKAFDTIGLVLGRVLFVMKSLVSSDNLNLFSEPTGLTKEHKKLIRRGKGLFRKSMAISAEDLINEIVTDVEAPDYGKEE